MSPSDHVQFRCPPELARQIDQMAAEQNLSRSQTVRAALWLGLEQMRLEQNPQPTPQPRHRMLGRRLVVREP